MEAVLCESLEENSLAIKIILLVLFFGVMIFIGFWSRRHATNVNDYVLGGRTVGPWLTAFAFGTSYFSSVVFVGYAGQFGWKFGLASTWIGLGNALIGSLLAWIILGRRTRIMTQKLDARTMPEYFGKRYGSQALQVVGSIISFVFLVPYTAGVYNGLSRLFGMAFSIDYHVVIIIMALLTAVYVIAGGYMATALNDFIQGIIMLGGIAAVIAAVLHGQGGFLNAMKELSIIDASDVAKPALQGAEGLLTSFFGPDPAALLGVVILTSLGTWGLPQMVQKFYAIKDEKSVQTGTVISTFFAFVVAGGCYFLGGFGRLFGDVPGVHNEDGSIAFDAIIPSMLSTLPDILIGIVIVLVLSASMSTLSSLVLTSSSTMTLDFLKKTWWQDMSEKTQLVVMRVLIAVFIVISVALAFNPPAFIAQMMGVSWGGLAGAFLAPFMYGLYSKNVTKLSVWVSFAWGVLFTVMNMFFHYIASPINAGAITMIVGLILVPLVSYVTPKMDKDEMEDLFAVYDEEVVVHKSHSLQEGTIKAVRAVKARED